TYAIWLLGENLLADSSDYAHDFRLRDAQARPLLDHGGIWLLELNKFHTEQVHTEQERWLKFFKDGEALDSSALPSWMQTPEMTQAMNTLKTFSEKERAYHTYQARQNYLREQRGIQRHLDELQAEAEQERANAEQERAAKEQERAAKEQERAAKEQALQEKDAALAEIERLKAQLRGQGHTE
ncbi:PD-(D/E)XK nuclease family transposase, partial [Thiocystis violacea]|uniref:PD-(D/E)XK nuclease family transposase n=1 Tax=Thiocystis violacea TaxID=13725 RepID=UPI001F5B9C4F